MRLLKLAVVFGFGGILLAQEPTFTFTPAHGNAVKGRFSPGGSVSFIDQYDGSVSFIDAGKIEGIVMTARKPPFTTKCGTSSRVVVTLTDGTRQHGCFGPNPQSFIGSTAIPSVNNMIGKFVRDKR